MQNKTVSIEDVLPSRSRARGERQGSAKLTEDAVRQIRELYKQGGSLAALGRAFGVTPQAISAMLDGKTWRHVV